MQITRMNSTAQDIARLIHGYLTITKQRRQLNYSLITQSWMLDKLAAWYGRTMSRSTLNYNLAILRERGFVKSIRRHRTNPETGAFEPRPTLYVMTKRLRSAMAKLARYFSHIGWKNLLERRPKEETAPAPQSAPAATYSPGFAPDFQALREQMGWT